MKSGKINFVVDGQWGSTGKGKLSGWLSRKYDISMVICDFSANAGHTFVEDDGKKVVTHVIPSAAIANPDIKDIIISAGSCFKTADLFREIDMYNVNPNRIKIHPHAAIIDALNVEEDEKRCKRIASTCQGVGSAFASKIMRDQTLAIDTPSISKFIYKNTELKIHSEIQRGSIILYEGSQGFDLSLNHGNRYPYVTSRDCNPCRMMSDLGISHRHFGSVYMSIRTYPIRVGHIKMKGEMIGVSGPFYYDQEEILFGDIGQSQEITTCTKRPRRLFTFSGAQFRKSLRFIEPDFIFLNFLNYLESSDRVEFVGNLEHIIKEVDSDASIDLFGIGPKNGDMVDLSYVSKEEKSRILSLSTHTKKVGE